MYVKYLIKECDKMLRIAVCDDENVICSILEEYIKQICDSLSIEIEIDVFYTGESFINYLSKNTYNLIFLDIELNKCSGIDVSRYIRDTLLDDSMQIIFVSGKNGYDRQLFEFRPFSFIEKPFTIERILFIFEKYLYIYGNKSDIFHYKYGHDTFWVKLSKIIYFKSVDRKVIIKTSSDEDEFYGALEKINEQLKGQGFIMPNKSYIVNYRVIKSFQSELIILTNGEEIHIARTKKKEIAKLQLVLENGGFYHEF